MNEDLKKLHDLLSREGYYTKDFDEFSNKYASDEAYREKVFDVVSRDGFYTKSKEEFFEKYPSTILPAEEPAPEVKKKDIMEPSLEDGSLVSPESEPSAPPQIVDESLEQSVIPTTLGAFDSPVTGETVDVRETAYQDPVEALMQAGITDEAEIQLAVEQREKDRALAQANIEAEAPALEEFLKEEARKEEEQVKERNWQGVLEEDSQGRMIWLLKGVRNKVEESFQLTNPHQIEIALRNNFDFYGFYFNRSYDDKLTIISPDGRKKIQVDLKTPDSEEQLFLVKNFVSSYYELDYLSHKDDLKKGLTTTFNFTDLPELAAKVKASREVGRRNKDGSVSTVLMASGEVDGEYVAFPTLFPKDSENYGAAPEYWQELPFGEALDLAKERGEVYYFDTDEAAKEFAEGSWKDVTDADYEGQAFYEKRGLNYMRDKRIVDTYTKARDIVLLIEDDEVPFRQNELTPEDQEKYAELYINGKRREDLEDIKNKYASTVETLEREYLDDEYQDVREDFDVYMQKRYESEIQKAIQVNEVAKSQLESVANKSLELFGVADPRKIQSDNNEAELLLLEFEGAKMTAEAAADQYENAKLFFDNKHDKSAKKRYSDNWEAFTDEVSEAYSRGKAGDVILMYSMMPDFVSGYDSDDPASTRKVAEELVRHMSKESETKSRVMSRWQRARGFNESLDVVLDDPAEWMATLAGTSLSQMAPYGVKIVPASTITGTAVGAAVGASAAGAGAIPGAALGFSRGMRVGFAATNLALEYTNAVTDAMRELGYKIDNPEDVAKALQNKDVWDKGRKKGLERGVPIAVVDYLSAGLAGRVFRVSPIARKGNKIARQTAERFVFDPAAEAFGELAAQVSAGQEVDWKEIAAEAGGGPASNTASMAVNMAIDARFNNDVELASRLTDFQYMANVGASSQRIADWTNNMLQLGKIDEQTAKRINDNVGVLREAQQLLGVGRRSGKYRGRNKGTLEGRLSLLLAARADFQATFNSREIYADRIKRINDEIKYIVDNKSMLPEDQQVLLLGYEGQGTQSALPTYTIRRGFRDVKVTREEFIKRLREIDSKEKFSKFNGTVENDEEIAAEMMQKAELFQEEEEVDLEGMPEKVEEEADETVVEQSQSLEELLVERGILDEEVDETDEGKTEEEVKAERIDRDRQQPERKPRPKPTEEPAAEKKVFALEIIGEKMVNDKGVVGTIKEENGGIVWESEDGTEVIDGGGRENASTVTINDMRLSFPPDVTPEAPVELTPETKQEFVPAEQKTQEELEVMSELEVEEARRKVDEDVQEFEDTILDEIERESENERILFKFKGSEFAVSQKPDGTFVVSKKNAKGKYVSVSNKKQRADVIAEFEDIKEDRDNERLRLAEELVLDYKQELLEPFGEKVERPKVQAPPKKKRRKSRKKGESVTPKQEAAPVAEEPAPVVEDVVEEAAPIVEEAAPVAEEAAPVAEEVVDSKDAKKIASIEEEISDLESDVENSESKIEELKEEIEIEKGNTKDGVAEFREKIKNEKNKEKKEELREELQDFKDEQSSLIDSYKEDISVEKSEASSARRKIANRKKKLSQLGIQPKVEEAAPIVEEAAPVAEEVIEEVAVEEVVEEVAEPKRGVLEDAEFENILRRSQLNPDLLKKELDEFAEYERQIEELQDSPSELKKVKAKEAKRKNAIKKARRGKIAEIEKEQEQVRKAEETKRKAEERKETKRELNTAEKLRSEISTLTKIRDKSKEGTDEYNRAQSAIDEKTKGLNNLLGVTPERKKKSGPTIQPKTRQEKKAASDSKKKQSRISKIVAKARKAESDLTELSKQLIEAQENKQKIFDSDKFNPRGLKAADKKIASLKAKIEKLNQSKNQLAQELSTIQGIQFQLNAAQFGANKVFEVQSPTDIQYASFVEKLSSAFPTLEVAATKQEFERLLKDPEVKKLTTKSQKIYGAVYQGKLYLNPGLANYNTPVHEFGHVWMNAAKELRPDLYKKGIELVKKSQYLDQVRNSADYSQLIARMKRQGMSQAEIDAYIAEEALATAIGDKGESFVNAAQKRNFKSWLNDLFKFIKKLTGISKFTEEQVQNLTFDEFLQGVVVDLMSENELFEGAESAKLASTLQLMSAPSNQTMINIIETARASGKHSDATIKEFLKAKGYKVDEINAALADKARYFELMPESFRKIVGGYNAASKLFNETRLALAEFKKKTQATNSEVRAKAKELLESHSVFNEQTEQVQKEIMLGFDNMLGIKANKNVAQEIANIRNNLKQRKIAVKNLKAEQKAMRDFIRRNLILSKNYSSADVVKLLNALSDATTPEKFEAVALKALNIIERQKVVKKKDLISEIKKLVTRKTIKNPPDNNQRVRPRGLDAQGESFFEQAQRIVDAYMNIDKFPRKIQEIENELASQEGLISELLGKEERGERRTSEQQSLLDLAYAYDILGGMDSMTADEISDVLDALKGEKKKSAIRLKESRLARKAKYDAVIGEANRQLMDSNPLLFNEDGKPRNTNEIQEKKDEIAETFLKRGFLNAIKTLKNAYDVSSKASIFKSLATSFKSLKTFMNRLDRVTQGKNVFTKNVYDKINMMIEVRNDYNRKTLSDLDSIARDAGFDNYVALKKALYVGTLKIGTKRMHGNQALRVYALYQNEVQRKKLNRQGIGDKEIQQIEDALGSKAIKFADGVVNYLSTTYYNQVNDVHIGVNDVGVPFVENYFPTKTLIQNQEMARDLLGSDGSDFMKSFDAQTQSALKQRIDTEGEVELYKTDFTSALEYHYTSMNKFRAYAMGVKEINALLSSPAVKTLLDLTGLTNPVRAAINHEVNPERTMVLTQGSPIVNFLMSRFVSLMLNFKIWQIPKQFSSFIAAFKDYDYTGEDSSLPDVLRRRVDFPMFVLENLVTMALLPLDLVKNGPISKMREKSATFDERARESLSGDVVNLVGNNLKVSEPDALKRLTYNQRRALSILSGEPIRKIGNAMGTGLGDILGIIGYITNYKRNIKNGMSEEEALKVFNNYNTTQQSRRTTDKAAVQNNPALANKFFTLFASMPLLMINNVMSAALNISRDVVSTKPRMPRTEDLRSFALNLGVINVAFVATANFFKFTKGDDEDRDEVYQDLINAAMGVNLLLEIPMLSGIFQDLDAAGRIMAAVKGEDYKRKFQIRSGTAVDPLRQIYYRINKEIKEGKGAIEATLKTILELGLGASSDPAVGIGNLIRGRGFTKQDGIESVKDFYDLMGVSKSYRPSYLYDEEKKSKEKSYNYKFEIQKEMDTQINIIYNEMDLDLGDDDIITEQDLMDEIFEGME